ncbi:hypothetical protein [Amycolatopsis sp. NPDC059657]|uniref:hypothetical protein n=1 Tax=Amycolatopsis sp. NPDC059657 TaxID=3346899 RepID=UPI003672E84E
MPTRTAVLAIGFVLLVVAGAGTLAVTATSAGSPPDLGPPVVAPALHNGTADRGAPPAPVPPRVAGDGDDVDDDGDDLDDLDDLDDFDD